jgi:hypothetical protein
MILLKSLTASWWKEAENTRRMKEQIEEEKA